MCVGDAKPWACRRSVRDHLNSVWRLLWARRVDIMSKAHPPKLKKFMDKKLSLKLNGGRHVQGISWGFDPFMNLVIDKCVEMATSGQQNNTGMVVIRGNSIIMLEALERVWAMAVFTRKINCFHVSPSPHFTTRKIGLCTFSYWAFLLNKLL